MVRMQFPSIVLDTCTGYTVMPAFGSSWPYWVEDGETLSFMQTIVLSIHD